MQRWGRAVLLACALAAGLVPAAGADTETFTGELTAPTDFVRIHVQAGEQGASVRLAVSLDVSQTAAGTLVSGVALGVEQDGYKGGLTQAEVVLSTGASVGVWAEGLGATVGAGSPVNLVYEMTGGATAELGPNASLDAIYFFPNGQVHSYDFRAETSKPVTETTLTTGLGAHILSVGDASDEGAAIAVAGVASGAVTQRRTLASPIAGTIIADCTCRGTWLPPGADWAPEWSQPQDPDWPVPFRQFAGDAGEWQWTWEGEQAFVGSMDAVYGAYVEVDDWRLFRSGGGG